MAFFYIDFSSWTIEAENSDKALEKAEDILLKQNKHPLVVNCELIGEEREETQTTECYEE